MVSLSSLTVFLLLQVYIGNCLNIPTKERHELDAYANEFTQLRQNSTELQSSSMENYSGRHYEDLLVSDGELHSVNQGLSSNIVSRGSSSISSGEEPDGSEHFGLSARVDDLRPFIIDEIDLSPTTNRLKECKLTRKEINLMFQECIYCNQTKSSMLGNKNVTISEPNLRDYDAHFLKYCRRAPELRECIKNFIKRTKAHCLDEGHHGTINHIDNATTVLIKFFCNQEADRISIFIADGGLECLLSRHYRMYICLLFNAGHYTVLSITELTSLVAQLTSLDLNTLKCTSIRGAEHCITRELELCEHQVSAIATGVLFNIIKEIASCEDSTEVTEEMTEELTEVPEDLTELPEDLTELPEDLPEVPEDLTELPEYLTEVPEDLTVLPEDLTEDLPEVAEDLTEDLTEDQTEVPEDLTELPVSESSNEAQMTEANRRIRSHHPDNLGHIASNSSVESSTSDSPSKLSTFSLVVDTDSINDGQNTQDGDEMPRSSTKLDSAVVDRAPIYPDILSSTTTVESLGFDGQIRETEDTMTTTSPIVTGFDGQTSQDEDEMPPYGTTASPIVTGFDGQIREDEDTMSTTSPIVTSFDGQTPQDEDEMPPYSTTTSLAMENEVSEKSIYNVVLETHTSSSATAGILCALVLFYSVIILTYKFMLSNNMK